MDQQMMRPQGSLNLVAASSRTTAWFSRGRNLLEQLFPGEIPRCAWRTAPLGMTPVAKGSNWTSTGCHGLLWSSGGAVRSGAFARDEGVRSFKSQPPPGVAASCPGAI